MTCESHKGNSLDFNGIEIFENFINTQEEMDIVRKIDLWDWKASQSGRRKQVKIFMIGVYPQRENAVILSIGLSSVTLYSN